MCIRDSQRLGARRTHHDPRVAFQQKLHTVAPVDADHPLAADGLRLVRRNSFPAKTLHLAFRDRKSCLLYTSAAPAPATMQADPPTFRKSLRESAMKISLRSFLTPDRIDMPRSGKPSASHANRLSTLADTMAEASSFGLARIARAPQPASQPEHPAPASRADHVEDQRHGASLRPFRFAV